mmetsp:Transcript_7383/g.11019  ORF Transcript_7383/g.11019 Transcript_7383/m.11019 type:complete len:338 (+) Transcript_7383:36-1049(+)
MYGLVVFDEMGAAPIILAFLYFYITIIASHKLFKMTNSAVATGLNTEKLFVMTLLLACITRIMGFVSIGALNLRSIRIGYAKENYGKQQQPQPDEIFYEKCLLVLFDFPDFITLSAYTLLAVVWAETFLQSRRHWLSSMIYRKSLLVSYLVFNALLYLCQMVLYGLMFFPTASPTMWAGKVLFVVLTSINFGLPVLLLTLYVFLSLSFSGFPIRNDSSLHRQSLTGRALFVWTAGRMCWGVFALTAALQYSLATSNQAVNSQIYSVLMVFLFIFTELIPFKVVLKNRVLAVLGDDEVAANADYDDDNRYYREQKEVAGNGCWNDRSHSVEVVQQRLA